MVLHSADCETIPVLANKASLLGLPAAFVHPADADNGHHRHL